LTLRACSQITTGKDPAVDAPEWEPLLNLAPDHVDDFMWMGTVQLTDGTRLQMYKHYWTRGYLHLAEDGRAFVFVPKTPLRRGQPALALTRVLRQLGGMSGLEKRVVFIGDDLEGVALEVIAAEEEEEEFVVIHAMNMRKRFRGLYGEVRKWAK
jgi:hypothetical protein